MPMKGVHEADPIPQWVKSIEWQTLERETPGGFVVYEINIKLRREGLLCVVKAEKGNEGIVGFVGARDIRSLSGRLRQMIDSEMTKWKVDKYF